MPQASAAFGDTSGLGRDSRYMACVRFSDQYIRRVNVLNALQHRIERKHVNIFEHESDQNIKKIERIKQRLNDSIQKRLAYKLVLKTQTFSAIPDKKTALNKRYTSTAFQNDVREMLKYIKPDRIRERKAEVLYKENRLRYDILLNQNRQKFNRLYPEKIAWRGRYGELQEEENKEEEKPPTPSPTIEDKRKQSLATLRRRIISIDSAPQSPKKLPTIYSPTKVLSASFLSPSKSQTPVRTPLLSKPPSQSGPARRQEITMGFMKRQKSYLETQELATTVGEKVTSQLTSDESTDVGKILEPVVDKSIGNKECGIDENNNVVEEPKSAIPESAKISKKRVKSQQELLLPPIPSSRTNRVPTTPKQSEQKPVKLPPLKMTNK
ncbi:uncharacterized protein LOC127879977 [Dreissena polymorpha]|uniref:Uncharacterized protein n=1 Tax=Dreissena polymorpha TaxID=45954 RepID=A0A9D4RWC0_DREPO|nr:uncharacterized protein LOC127879977 [Dreissena polymorpha]XP_052283102.1 uncharacterized protein LOC127879977 [Dreissena polymorpha]KAH3881340.1 hypothetical protein DPMN_005265 [Dreissena polymorpha]